MDRQIGLALSSAILTISAFVVALKLFQPASIKVYLGNNGNSTLLNEIPGLYNLSDVLTVFAFSILIGVCASYILLSGKSANPKSIWKLSLEEKKNEWAEASKTLRDDEKRIYEAVLQADGVLNQGELVKETGLSKTTVSRTLDLLESKNLVERRRRGMGNVVVLK